MPSEHPELTKSIYQGFRDAKKFAVEAYEHGLIFNSMSTMFPWFSKLINQDRTLLGTDWWPYGIQANRKALDAILRYHAERDHQAPLHYRRHLRARTAHNLDLESENPL